MLALIFRNTLSTWISGLGEQVTQFTSNIGTDDLIGKAVNYATANPIPVALGLASAGSTIFGVWQKIGKMRADNKTQEIALAKIQGELISDSKINEANAAVNQYKDQIVGLQTQLNDNTLNNQLLDVQNSLSQKIQDIKGRDETIGTLKNLIEELKMKERIIVK